MRKDGCSFSNGHSREQSASGSLTVYYHGPYAILYNVLRHITAFIPVVPQGSVPAVPLTWPEFVVL